MGYIIVIAYSTSGQRVIAVINKPRVRLHPQTLSVYCNNSLAFLYNTVHRVDSSYDLMGPGSMYMWTLHIHFGHYRFKVVVGSTNVNTNTVNTLDVL